MKVTAIAFLSGHCVIECKHYYPILFAPRATSHHKPTVLWVISEFRGCENEILPLLEYYAALISI